jgi:hypothetical protein
LFALGIVCGGSIALWLREFSRDLDAKLRDEGLR